MHGLCHGLCGLFFNVLLILRGGVCRSMETGLGLRVKTAVGILRQAMDTRWFRCGRVGAIIAGFNRGKRRVYVAVRRRAGCGAVALMVLAGWAVPAGWVHADEPFLAAEIDEASGLVASQRHAGVYWTHNDNVNLPASNRAGPALLYAIGEDGQIRERLELVQVQRRDWEAITRMPLDGREVLVVGDIGDNRQRHPHYRLWFVEEPAQLRSAVIEPVKSKPLGSLRFTYPDGAHDAESLAWDATSGRVLVLTKRDETPGLYSLDVSRAAWGASQVARFEARLPPLPAPDPVSWLMSPLIGPHAHQPTDMALHPDGRRLAVLSYAAVYLFAREKDEPWATALQRQPRALPLPVIAQYEGLAWSRDGKTLRIVQEGAGTPFLSLAP